MNNAQRLTALQAICGLKMLRAERRGDQYGANVYRKMKRLMTDDDALLAEWAAIKTDPIIQELLKEEKDNARKEA